MSKSISKKTLRNFGLLIGILFPFLIGWLLPLISGHSFRMWTLFIGLPGLFIGIISPNTLTYPYKGWMALGHILGWINSRIILGLVFFLIVIPISFLMKAFRYDPLKKVSRSQTTYIESRKINQIDLTKIF